MAKIHDLFIVELAEVIKGYGNEPDDKDPFRLSEFYRFYELPNIAVSRENFEKMRPVEPEQKTGKWIPCSERLPEDSQFVLMTIRRMNEHYNHEPFISVGYISWNQSAWWCAHDGDCKSNDVRVDAWMPLPEPYKEGEQNED